MTESNSTYSGPKRSVKSYLKKLFSIAGIIIAILLAVIVLVGLIPVSHDGLESIPNPSTSYEASIARFEQLLADEQGVVNDASRSLLLTHGEKTSRVYVLVHGTTNSPHQWQEFGNKLFDLGNNVVILRMPYHGLLSHKVSELTPLTVKDIREYSDQTVDIAAGLGDDVYVIGLSGGGTVASWMAQNRTEVIKTLLLSPFYGIGPVPTSHTPILINAFTRLPNIVLTSPGEMFRDWAYMGESTRGVAAFLLFSHEGFQPGNGRERSTRSSFCFNHRQ